MKILVFGAGGRTGRLVVAEAVRRRHQVTAFVRNPRSAETTREGVALFEGDVTSADDVASAVKGHDAVIDTLGGKTPLKRYPGLVRGVANIIQAMKDVSTDRLVYLSFLGVHDSRRQLSPLGRYLVAPLILRNVVADHEAKEALILASGLNWTIVRAPRLTNGPALGRFRAGERVQANTMVPTLSRSDLASFMVDTLDREDTRGKALAVMD